MAALALCTMVFARCVGAGSAKETLPVLDCVVAYAHGGFNSYRGPVESDTITIDLGKIEKLKLDFKSGHNGPTYIPLRAPLKLAKKMREDLPQYLDMVFVSTDDDPPTKVTVEIRGAGGPGARKFEIYIILENDGFLRGVAVLEGTARK